MGEWLVSDEVAAALDATGGLGQAAELAQDFLCALCRTTGDVRRPEGAALVVERYRNGTCRCIFVHPQCAPSHVVDIDDLPAPQIGAAEQDVRTVAGILPGLPARPILVLQLLRTPSVIVDGAPTFDITDGLTKSGLHRVSGIRVPPPLAVSWVLTLDEFDQGRITDGAGDIVLDRLPPIPDGWRSAAAGSGDAVAVYAGTFDVSGLYAGGADVAVDQLDRALATGQLVAGAVPVHLTQPEPEMQRASRDVAEALEEAMRARAGDGGTLDQAPQIVQLPAGTRVIPLSLPGELPGVLVDFNLKPASQRALTAVLDALRGSGLGTVWDLEHTLPLAPADWGCVLWPSQILVLTGRAPEGRQRKLLFKSFRADTEWYNAAKNYQYGMALLVGSFGLRRHPDSLANAENIMLREMRCGRVVGGVMFKIAAV